MKQNFKECRYLIYSDLNATGGDCPKTIAT